MGGLRAGMPCIVWADICAALAPYCSILLWVNFLDAWIARNTSHISIHSPPPCLQRNDIVLDCCKIGLDEARFAQQAAALTGGIYLRVAEPAALLQYLLVRLGARGLAACATSKVSGLLNHNLVARSQMVFEAGSKTRALLRPPQSSGEEGGTTCMCHRQPIMIGQVCSVCLSVFCKPVPVCLTCGATFD